MPIIYTDEFSPAGLPQSTVRSVYNGLDCCITSEVLTALAPLSGNEPNVIYNFERALQAPVLEMMLRGFRIDEYERQKGCALLRSQIAHLQRWLDEMAHAIWGRPLNPASPKQLIDFLYRAMHLPEQWKSEKGQKRISTDREALEKLEVYFYARPIISTILEIRNLRKKLSVLETEIDADGRMRTSYNIAGTETGRWSSSSNAFGTGCVLPSAEALTRFGWKRMDFLQDGEEIAQYDKGEISFVPCKIYKTQGTGSILTVDSEQVKISLTPQHRVFHFGPQNNDLLVEPAIKVAMRSQTYIPLGGKLTGGQLTYDPYLAMLMADFSKATPCGWRGAFKKERKIERFLALAKIYGIPFTEQKINKEGYRKFHISGKHYSNNYPKKWGSWVLELTQECAQALVEEARYWDSHDRGAGFIFYSADKEQAEWFATLAHLAGRSATIRRQEQTEGSYSTTTMWAVNVKNKDYVQVKRKHWTQNNYSGDVYCPQVPSSFWLVRQDGYISVTGNTNLQNITSELRKIFIADPGYKLIGIDLEQAESREVGWQCGILFDDWSYLDAAYSGDLHTTVTRLNWRNLPWTDDPKANKALAERPYYRHYSYRDMSKKLGHGSNYFGQPWTMARHAKIPTKMAEDFQIRYFEAFPGIPRWHRHVAQQLQQNQLLVTPFGRRRHFFGRPNDDATLREAIAFVPQSSTGDRMNLGLFRIWKHMRDRVQLIAQVHDAVYFQMPEHLDEREIVAEALERINVELTYGERKLIVPGEAKSGWNWGNWDEKTNPNGLKKCKGKDTRERLSGLNRVM